MLRIIIITIITLFIPILLMSSKPLTTEASEFKVGGSCGMCKTRIEKAAESEGVVSALWELKTQMLKVENQPETIELGTIHQNIADAGHDTEMFRAEDEIYDKLPACCKYERFLKSDGLETE